MDEDKKKSIDESWKEAVEKEKTQKSQDNKEAPELEPDFNFFISTLGIQASIALGEIPNPITKKKEENLNQAKFIIDTLGLLKEKTKGNLTDEETKVLDNILYELRTSYISKTKS